jgi:Ca2+-binding RTX toxin-like protein
MPRRRALHFLNIHLRQVFMGFYSEQQDPLQDPLQIIDAPEPLPEEIWLSYGEKLDPATDYAATALSSTDPLILTSAAEIKLKDNTAARLLARPEVEITGTDAGETLRGEKGKTNSISGLGGNDVLLGMEQGDIISGGTGDDRIGGGGGGDFLYGDAGNDTIKGGGGSDYLQGDRGDDQLSGGGGVDQFAIQKNKGLDTILDYRDGVDKLATFNVTFEKLTIAQQGADTVIRSGSTAIALLKNVSASSITADDFVVPLPAVV